MIVCYGIYFVSFIRSFRLGFGIVSTVWYVLVYILYVYLFSVRRNIECKYQERNFETLASLRLTMYILTDIYTFIIEKLSFGPSNLTLQKYATS
jgi:hypothetical protein